MVTRSRSSQPSLSCVGEPICRPFLNKRQRESSSLLQPDFGTLVLSRRCPSGRLVQGSPIHVPTHSSASLVTSQDQMRRNRCDCHPTLVAEEGLVTFGIESSGRSTCPSASSTKSAKESTRASSPRPQNPPTSRLAALGETLQAAGVSEAAAQTICTGKRQSTRDWYDSKWRNFCCWCTEESVDPLHPTPQQVLDYLEHLADTMYSVISQYHSDAYICV